MEKVKLDGLVNRMLVLQDDFRELYEDGRLVGVSKNGVHVSLSFFLKMFRDFDKQESDTYYHYVASYGGIRFYALLDKLEEVVSMRLKSDWMREHTPDLFGSIMTCYEQFVDDLGEREDVAAEELRELYQMMETEGFDATVVVDYERLKLMVYVEEEAEPIMFDLLDFPLEELEALEREGWRQNR